MNIKSLIYNGVVKLCLFSLVALIACNSMNEENGKTICGQWYGYSDSLGFFEVTADSSRIRIFSSIEGVKKVYRYKIVDDKFYNIDLLTNSIFIGSDSVAIFNIGVFNEKVTIYKYSKEIENFHLEKQIEWEYFLSQYKGLINRREGYYRDKMGWSESDIQDLIVIDSGLIIENEVKLYRPDFFYGSKRISDYVNYLDSIDVSDSLN